MVEGTQAIPFALDVEDGHFEYIGPQGPQRLGFSEELWKQIGFLDRLMPRDRNGAVRGQIDDSKTGNFEIEATVLTQDEKRVDLRWVASCEQSDNTGQHKVLRGMMLDVTDQRRLENDLAQAQKLESVGRLAAGVAHEINTPVQFVSDSVSFVREAMDDLSQIVDKYRELRTATQADNDHGADVAAAAKAAEEAEDDADLDYILENAPVALDRARDGLGRVAAIVRSMKEFAHPDRKEMAQVDLNQAISSTLVIATNEYKYVAEIETGVRASCRRSTVTPARSTRWCSTSSSTPRTRSATWSRAPTSKGKIRVAHARARRAGRRSRSATPARAFRSRCARASSIRSSPPRKSARARARVWPSRAAWSSTSTAARCTSRPSSARARRSTSACRSPVPPSRVGGRLRMNHMKHAKVSTSHIQAVTGTTFVATLSSLLFGYATAVISGVVGAIEHNFIAPRELGNTAANALLGLTVCSALVGTIIGALVARPTAAL